MKNFYDFEVTDINGDVISMRKFKGKKLMLVNVASECGLTPQYSLLQELYDTFKDKGFSIIGFPANNFGAQEPGTNEEIKLFCQREFQVSFPMMSKISVKGKDQHDIYKWLTHKSENGIEDVEMEWNFQKFLIDENGNYKGHLKPSESPADDRVMNWIS